MRERFKAVVVIVFIQGEGFGFLILTQPRLGQSSNIFLFDA